MNTKKLIVSSLFAALTFIATMVIQIKLSANGFVNLGDCMVIIGAIYLGPLYGALSAGIGSALADLICGYTIYAPATFIIKALMAIAVSLLYKKLKNKNSFLSVLICAFCAELIMVLGYFLYEVLLYGIGTALIGMPGNLLQAGFGIVCSVILCKVLSKNKYITGQTRF